MSVENAQHIGKNIRSIRLLKGMKQETFAYKLGIAQQNVSKMEKKTKVSQEKLEAAAKVLGITVEAIEKFNEKTVLNNNIALEEHAGQIVHPIKEVIEYFKEELLKKDNKLNERDIEIQSLKAELEEYRSMKKKPSKPADKTGAAKILHKITELPGKQAAQ